MVPSWITSSSRLRSYAPSCGAQADCRWTIVGCRVAGCCHLKTAQLRCAPARKFETRNSNFANSVERRASEVTIRGGSDTREQRFQHLAILGFRFRFTDIGFAVSTFEFRSREAGRRDEVKSEKSGRESGQVSPAAKSEPKVARQTETSPTEAERLSISSVSRKTREKSESFSGPRHPTSRRRREKLPLWSEIGHSVDGRGSLNGNSWPDGRGTKRGELVMCEMTNSVLEAHGFFVHSTISGAGAIWGAAGPSRVPTKLKKAFGISQ